MKLKLYAALVCSFLLTSNIMAQKDRSSIDPKYTWRVQDLFPSPEKWQEAKDLAVEQAKQITNFKGKLGQSAADLLNYFQFSSDVAKQFSRLSIYCSLLYDQDRGNADNLARDKEMEQAYTDYSLLAAFARPELAAISSETFQQFLAEEPRLQQYSMDILRIERNKAHTLSDAEEELLSLTNLLGDVPYTAFGIFSNAEMPWPRVVLSSGEEVEVNQAAFSQYRASANRDDREKVFYAFWQNYKLFEGTMGELMNGNIRQNVFYARARRYPSALEASLYRNNIPVEVYHSLIENVHRALPTFHRYLALKQRLMQLDTLKYSDIYAPAVADVELSYSYEEAQQLVLEALTPLGDDYKAVVKRAFDEQWIDVYPNKGKASGAYSNGSAYDVHPYILMNYNGQYDHVGTLIHELGHTMHSYYSNKHQPYNTSRYATFVAEVASTFNEALLDHMMMQRLTDKEQKISLLVNMLDGFKGTLFRQTQFAEFELEMHRMVERGEPITGQKLSELYGRIVRLYYGHDQGVCFVDKCVDQEWQFVPHFYMGFYVYQYSTAFVASQALSQMVLSGDDDALRRYLHFLTTGCSQFPIDILREAGVDMTQSEPFDHVIAKMNSLMDQVEELMK